MISRFAASRWIKNDHSVGTADVYRTAIFRDRSTTLCFILSPDRNVYDPVIKLGNFYMTVHELVTVVAVINVYPSMPLPAGTNQLPVTSLRLGTMHWPTLGLTESWCTFREPQHTQSH